jgi:hypothetical protein
MRIAVLGAAAAALLGGALAITPLDTVDTPARGSAACTGASCERLASVLVPQAGPPAAPKLAAPAVPAPAPPAPTSYVPPPLTHPAAARVIAPGLGAPPAVPSATVPRLGVPAAPGQPGAVIPGTDIPIPPDLINQGYAIVNGVVAAESVQAAGPIIGGVVGGASGLVGAVGGVGGSALNILVTLEELRNGTGDPTTANLISLLIPQVRVLQQLDPQLTAQLNSINLAKLTSVPAIQAALPALRNLPPPNLAALPSPEQVLAGLRTLPPPQLPPLPPPPVICGPWIGFWQPCI